MKEITTEELQEQLKTGAVLHMIDVREDDEVAQGMIPGAIHIPLGELLGRLDEIDQAKSYIMICRSSGRSGRACEFLEDQGYDVTNMVGGMLDWHGEVK
ncbi:rhodanese-like domain-containing protein [Sporosarcina thermotolerans]|uniref:Rhodanese-like domain-containing protein n=1 Tax=Sporosarcina thermotolerans TaxID=633404 RepID=A0AAW9A708_9BACL|nr:rhodanese-like domain-containing protein [Sporosarcina thermotolerans]MDW0116784.1 rhodanese-like domain-containing protein [Sporosarcina thermotolerans]WHT48960.1 rhodanese-like domain-containing protein [Sporosarcina thermotolerans]